MITGLAVAEGERCLGHLTDTSVKPAVNLWTTSSTNAKADIAYGNISDWDVSAVTALDSVFQSKTDFNADLSSWDVSRVTTMYFAFYSASAFESPLSNWNVSKVTNMHYMFHDSAGRYVVHCGDAWNTNPATHEEIVGGRMITGLAVQKGSNALAN